MSDLYERVRQAALAYPEAYEEAPWGERVVKVRKKVFVFLGRGEQGLGLSLKLPDSKERALELPGAAPTAYGLGKHGWVSLMFATPEAAPMAEVLEWLDESYRAVAPKKLVRALDERGSVEVLETPALRLDGRRVLLVGDDPLRLQRCTEIVARLGADVLEIPLDGALDAAGAGAPEAVVVDLSRHAAAAIALLGEIGLVAGGAPILVAGVRDATMERTLAELSGLDLLSREPPGAPAFVALLVERLR